MVKIVEGYNFRMLLLTPTLVGVWACTNTVDKVDEREMKEMRDAKQDYKEYKTSLMPGNKAPNLRILTHLEICKSTQNKIKTQKGKQSQPQQKSQINVIHASMPILQYATYRYVSPMFWHQNILKKIPPLKTS